ncbi:MAG: hypothetical protein E7451_04380 [Ruminococcaceae bacterium]|nr:hypothetical protein [Oscillospiraceae bacterium]
MAKFFSPKGELLYPYSLEMLEKTVAASRGAMKPGCKFKCTMYSNETPNMWSLPCVFRARYVSLDEGIRISYRVRAGAIVWLLMLLPMALLVGLLAAGIPVEFTGVLGALIGLVAFAYNFQRGKAVERFEKRFGK